MDLPYIFHMFPIQNHGKFLDLFGVPFAPKPWKAPGTDSGASNTEAPTELKKTARKGRDDPRDDPTKFWFLIFYF